MKKEMAFRILMLTGQLLVMVMANLGSTGFNIHFKKVKARNVAMETFLNLTTGSRISCAAQCAKNRVDCYSYTYANHNCKLGTWLTPSNTTLDANLYMYTVGAFCNVTDNFHVLKNGSSSACVRLSSDSLNFSDARAACQAFGIGVDLYIMKYAAKYYMIEELLKSLKHDFWVGLHDMAQEDVFKFIDDDLVLTQELRNLIFAPGQPNSYGGNEDCVDFYQEISGFNDAACDKKVSYVCEQSPNVEFDI